MQPNSPEELPLQAILDTEFDLIVGLRVTTADATQLWQQMAAAGLPLVYDLDDDFFAIPADNPAHRYFNQPEVQARIKDNIRLAQAVTVTNEYLADVVREYNPNVHILPNMVDAALLDWQRPHAEKVTIGWSGTSHHDVDFDSAAKPLAAFFSRRPDVDLHMVGADYRDRVKQPNARHSAWTSAERFHQLLDFDIGIIPLAWLPFNRAKSDIKLLDMAALGIPVVASDYGPYAVINHGKTGYLVNSDHEWKKYLGELVDDPAMRQAMGENAKEWASSRTIQKNIHLWEAVYQQVLDQA